LSLGKDLRWLCSLKIFNAATPPIQLGCRFFPPKKVAAPQLASKLLLQKKTKCSSHSYPTALAGLKHARRPYGFPPKADSEGFYDCETQAPSFFVLFLISFWLLSVS
jgi:hypothetical protein